MTHQPTPAAQILRIVCETTIEANDVGGVDLNDLVDRLAAAGYELPGEDEPTAAEQRHSASTITDDALDALYAELERTGRLLRRAQARARHWQGRAERYRQAWKSASRDRRTLTNGVTRRAPLLGQSQAALARVHAVARDWGPNLLPRSEAHRLFADLCAALNGPCEQHPHAPRIGGLCGGCTQYPTDMTPETR